MADVDVANLALGRLGISQAITSLDEQSTPAKICKRFFAQCRQEVLRFFPWGLASTVVQIAEVDAQTYPGWTYVYEYPETALMVWAVADSAGIRSVISSIGACDWNEFQTLRGRRYPFQVALKSDGADRVLLSDVPNAYAYFTADATNSGVWTPDFVSVFAWRLAMEVGGPLSAKRELIGQARSEYLFWRGQMAAQDMNERRDDKTPDSDSISCRY